MASVLCFSTCQSPIGEVLLTSDGDTLTGVYPSSHRSIPKLDGWKRDDGFFTGVRDQLRGYFAGELTEFEVPLGPAGTDFQQRVWSSLRTIPFGVTRTYSQLANGIDKPTASRAVGLANGKNPISIIVPCHRVIGANGALTGYAGGLELKAWLLAHEANVLSSPKPRKPELTPPLGMQAVARVSTATTRT